jgi:4'-phosphopantetheinyl transferase
LTPCDHAASDVTRDQSRFGDSAVLLWRVGLAVDERTAMALRGHLASDESERLERLRDPDVGRRWLVSRGALREILGAELGVSPASVRLRLGDHGRPRLDSDGVPGDLDFNLSHSGELALIAVAHGGLRVGVDVERLRPGRNPLRVADRYFSPDEVAALGAAGAAERPHEFLRYWTAKEALAKGLGLGLRAPPGELELTRDADRSLTPMRADGWNLTEIAGLPEGYHGALAVDRAGARITIRDWIPDEAPAGP